MSISTEFVEGMLTLVRPNGDYLETPWEAPLDNETFNSVCAKTLERAKVFVADFNLSLRDYLVEKALDAYVTWIKTPADDANPASVEADQLLKIWLRVLSDFAGSPNFTFYLRDDGTVNFEVEPLPDREVVAKFMIQSALLVEGIRNIAHREVR
ncbi:hypothetical protein JKG68_27210 [Microvirga aerilata]|uniref:Uncharacterized protein n=1 Tax=Microvirga aerilata TaxID=670292 RepID=A0A937D390_9HYPH|nr:hypothetical protein [Microvirga aerilata]MBL0407612.1 hypothetical protein [Microvirga aerilata]